MDRTGVDIARVRAHAAVKDNSGCIALERGPLVYCVEGIDNEVDTTQLGVDVAATLEAVPLPELPGGTTVVRGAA